MLTWGDNSRGQLGHTHPGTSTPYSVNVSLTKLTAVLLHFKIADSSVPAVNDFAHLLQTFFGHILHVSLQLYNLCFVFFVSFMVKCLVGTLLLATVILLF